MKQTDTAAHLTVGALGEKIASHWLGERGYVPRGNNYRKKWGEIDLIMKRGEVIHFVEVKTVSYETREQLEKSVSRGTFRPEENVHFRKLQRLRRAIETWIAENSYSGKYQLDVATVRMVPREKYAVLDVIEKVNLE